MTDSERLERGYRRLVALYPRAFRRDSEQEIVAVLMATAREGQRRADLAESADLIRGALRMHRGPRLPRALLRAVRLTYAGAAAELGVLITLLVTLGSLISATIRGYPDFSEAQWHAVLLAHLTAAAAGGPIVLALWVWIACANARGNHAGRLAFRVVHVILTLGVVAVTYAGVPVYGMASAIAGGVMIQIQLAALALIFYPSKTPLPYRPHRQLGPPSPALGPHDLRRQYSELRTPDWATINRTCNRPGPLRLCRWSRCWGPAAWGPGSS